MDKHKEVETVDDKELDNGWLDKVNNETQYA